ncbi:MAG: sigma 54-interacting transcriptional regulator [Deltaproteobacteria bacterium]|nr:sigma 54-interacting transcriptional regulator [Deltaproteobacteria bacterium]
MQTIEAMGLKKQDELFLLLSALFDGEFSIDWIQALSKSKITQILKAFEQFIHDGIIKKHDVGLYSLKDHKKKLLLRQAIPVELREKLHRDIAELLLNDDSTADGLLRAAQQLLHITNDLKGCRVLSQAGDTYRHNGRGGKALVYYNKAIQDLKKLDGYDADMNFIDTVIGYSKDQRAIRNLKLLISYLKEALARTRKWNHQQKEAQVLLYLACNIYIGQNVEAAKEYLDQGFELARGLNDPQLERTMLTGMVISHFYSGRYKSAVKVYETSEPMFAEKHPMHKLSLRMAMLMGLSYAFIGRISEGMGLLDGLHSHALKIKDYETATGVAVNMGRVAMLSHKFDEAIELLLANLAIPKRGSAYGMSIGLSYLAYCYYRKGELDKSRDYLIEALKTSSENYYDIKITPSYIEILLAMERGEFPLLPDIAPKEEMQHLLAGNNVLVNGVIHRSLAVLNWQDQTPDARLKRLTDSLALLEESGFSTEIAKTKLALGRHYLETGKTKKARDFVTDASKVLMPIDHKLVPSDLQYLVENSNVGNTLLEEILTLSQDVVGIRDIQEGVQYIFSAISRITGAERAAIFLQTDGADPVPIKLWAAKNLTANDIELPEFSSSLKMIHQAAKTGKPCSQKIFQGENAAAIDQNRLKSSICVPLMLKGKTMGILYLDNRFFERTFEEKDIHILSYFASLAAIGIDNARAYEEIRRLNKRLFEEKQYLEEQQSSQNHPDDMVIASPAIKQVFSMVQRVAATESTVMILGETGVGKEIVARAIQRYSNRHDKPYIRVHCSAFPESLITSELFGHERGAFTGAVERRIGRFELADGGTIFLDEIGEISREVQVLLLRVLQTGEFERVGGRETLHSNFRLIVATNRNLAAEVEAGRFREDLYYRLNVFPITVPPLRNRREDIPPLAAYFLRMHSKKLGKSFKGISEKEMSKLLAYHWPGNVRELENVIERGVILSSGPLFHTPEFTKDSADENPASPAYSLQEMERRYIIETLEKTNGKIYGPGGAAELLGINYSTLYSRMKKLGIRKAHR